MGVDGVNEILLRVRSVGGKKAAAELRELGAAGKEASDESESFGSKVTSFMGKASNAAMFATLAAGVEVVKHAVEDYGKLEVAQAGLHTSLINNHVNHAHKAQSSIEATARASKNTGGFGVQEEIEAMTHFITTSGSVMKARKYTNDAVNLARLMHVELSDAIKITTAGEVAALKPVQKQLGIMEEVVTWKKKEKEAEKAGNYQKAASLKALDQKLTGEAILLRVEKKASGARVQFAHTLTGVWDRFKLKITEVYDSIGKKLKPIIIGFFTFLSDHTGVLKVMAGILVGVVGVLDAYWMVMKVIRVVEILDIVLKGIWTAATWLQATATDALATSLVTAVLWVYNLGAGMIVATAGLALLALGIYYVITHWKQFKATVVDVFDWVKGHWPLLAGILLGPLGYGVAEIIKHFKLIETTAEGVFRGIASFVTKIFDGIVNGIIKAINFVIKIIDTIISVYDKVPSIFRPTGTIGQIGPLGEIGKSKPHQLALSAAAGTPAVLGAGSIFSQPLSRPTAGGDVMGGSLAGALTIHMPVNLDGKKIGESRHVVAGVEARQRQNHNKR